MTQPPRHLEIVDKMDLYLGSDNFYMVSRTADRQYQAWYATLLSSVVLLAGDQEILYAYTDHDPTVKDFRIVVFTTALVFVADINPHSDGVPIVNATRRSSLIGMKLSASERIDTEGRRSYEWPGVLNLVLTYSDLETRVEIVADGVNRYNVKELSPIVALLEGLSADLAKDRVGV